MADGRFPVRFGIAFGLAVFAAPGLAAPESCVKLADAASYPPADRHLAPVTVDANTGWIGVAGDQLPPVALSAVEAMLFDDVMSRLKERQTQVVLALPPPRGLSDPSLKDGTTRAAIVSAAQDRAKELERSGAILADLTGFFQQLTDLGMPVYRSDDPGWTGDATLAAAQAVMRALEAQSIISAEPELADLTLASPGQSGRYAELVQRLCDSDSGTETTLSSMNAVAAEDAGNWLASSAVVEGAGQDAFATALSAVLSAPVKSAMAEGGSIWALHTILSQKPPELLIWEASDLNRPDRPLAALRAVSGQLTPDCADGPFRLTRKVTTEADTWVEGPLGLALQDRLEVTGLGDDQGPVSVEIGFPTYTEVVDIYPRRVKGGRMGFALNMVGERGQMPLHLRLKLPADAQSTAVDLTACPSKPLLRKIAFTGQSAP